MKRIDLAERTRRGIDRIYEGMLRNGRPGPDYGMSDDYTVTVRMSSADADFKFLEMILSHEGRTGRAMPIDSLIMLSHLREGGRLATAELSVFVQKP